MDKAPNCCARPFLPLLISLIAGIGFGVHLPGMPLLAVIVSIASVTGITVCLYRRKASRLLPLILFLTIGYLSIHPWIAPRFPAHHIVHYADGSKWRIVGQVHNHPRQLARRTRFVLNVRHLHEGTTTRHASGLLRVTVAGGEVDLMRGDHIELAGRIRSIRNFKNPGAFDYRRYMAFQKIWATVYSPAKKVRVLHRAAVSGPAGASALDAIRNRIETLIDQTREGRHRDVLRALILGDRTRITAQLREAFHRSGVGHLLAISGLHIGIVAGSAFIVLVAIASRFEILLWNAWVKKTAAIGAFIPALLYALIAGMSPSTQRALAMVGMFLLTFLLEREQDSINTLAVAAMVILFLHPPALYSISFQLSFAAVFFIIFILSRIHKAPGMQPVPLGRRLVRKLIAFITVTVAATLGTLPMVMAVFQQVSLVGVLTNCIFVPLVGFGVIPLALLAAVVLWFCPPVAGWCMQLAGWLLGLAIEGIESVAALPFSAVHTFVPSLFEIVCYYLLLGATVAMIPPADAVGGHGVSLKPQETAAAGKLNKSRHQRAAGPHRRSRWLVFVVMVATFGFLIDAGYWIHRRFYRNDLRVTVIDVGQGSAALLELPNGNTVMADGGGFADNTVFDVGERVVAPLLRRRKILTVETLILSHPNSDHLNGLIYIADRFGVKQIWSNGDKRDTLGYRRLQEVIDRRNIREISIEHLPGKRLLGGAEFQVFYPPMDFLEKKRMQPWRDTNTNSLVFKVGLGSIGFLFTGDITARAEKEMVRLAGSHLDAAVIMIPHHGSRSSSTEEFIEAVGPQIGVVSCGWQNRFGFPHSEVLQRYRQRHVRIYQTDADGAVELMTDGRLLQVIPWSDRGWW